VREAGQKCKDEHVQAVIAVGGGSVCDASKCITAQAVFDGDLWDVITFRAPAPTDPLPLYCVLTMSGTASEFDTGAVITDPVSHEKRPVFFKHPRASFIDPTVQMTLPWRQTCNGCVDATSHLLEQLMGSCEPAGDPVRLL